MKKHFTAHLIFAATALTSQQAWALGFGRAVSDAVLGQSFTFTVPVNVEPGERFGLDCLSAQVYYGESLLNPGAIRTELERGGAENSWVVRITAATPIEEPIIEVAISAGCERRFTRRFSVFADPPTLRANVTQPPQVAPVNTPAAASAQASAAVAAVAASGAAPAQGVRSRRHTGAPSPMGVPRPHVVRKGPTVALANELRAGPYARHVQAGADARTPAPRVAVAPPADNSRLLLDVGVPHLKLDMEEPVIPPAGASSGAQIGLSDLDDPDVRALKALEQSIEAAKRDSQAQREQAARLQAELAAAQSRNGWMPWLFGLLAVALAAIGALVWKLRQQNRSAHSDWFNQSQLGAAPPTPVAEAAPAEEPPEQAPAPDLRDRVAAPVAAEPASAPLPLNDDDVTDARGAVPYVDQTATRPLDRRAMAAMLAPEAAPRELSVEELLDLEQQADFFIALGQEDAAVDLLMSHLRSAGGQSPLPYTKLLEIYKRQGDRAAYERTRARFNRRFNAYAPDWDTGPSAGRSLEDYPDTIALLEGAWGSPIDAMAILEGLLFKRDDTSELFDLPAYRDVLVLYSLARDLWQHGGGDASTAVDVLLPLDDLGPAALAPGAAPAYPSAREVNERAMPANDPGLDLESVDVEGDTRHGMLTSFEMTGYDPGHLDLDLSSGDGVHATLDDLSLAPVSPSRPRSTDWHGGDTPDSELPTKR